MLAKVTNEFPGRPDHEVLTRTIAVGELISGDLARLAVELECAEEVSEDSAADGASDLSKMTVEALKALAAEKGVDLGEATKKAEIIAVLSAAEAKAE